MIVNKPYKFLHCNKIYIFYNIVNPAIAYLCYI